MTDQGASTRRELDVRGEPVEIQWQMTPPRRWWQKWEGNVHYRHLPTDDHFGTLWMEDLHHRYAWTRTALERKLARNEAELLGFTQRPSIWTDGQEPRP